MFWASDHLESIPVMQTVILTLPQSWGKIQKNNPSYIANPDPDQIRAAKS